MKTPLQLEVHGFKPSSRLNHLIDSNLQKLETRFGRITACRVVIRAPGIQNGGGKPYAIGIRLTLPHGREINIAQNVDTHDRQLADVSYAINDAFRRALRRLREYSRKLQGRIKRHDNELRPS